MAFNLSQLAGPDEIFWVLAVRGPPWPQRDIEVTPCPCSTRRPPALERGALGHCLTVLSHPPTRATARCSQRPCHAVSGSRSHRLPQAMARSARARSAHAIDAGRGARRRRWRPPEAA